MEEVENKKLTASDIEEATKSVRFSEFQKAIDLIERSAREDIEKDENER